MIFQINGIIVAHLWIFPIYFGNWWRFFFGFLILCDWLSWILSLIVISLEVRCQHAACGPPWFWWFNEWGIGLLWTRRVSPGRTRSMLVYCLLCGLHVLVWSGETWWILPTWNFEQQLQLWWTMFQIHKSSLNWPHELSGVWSFRVALLCLGCLGGSAFLSRLLLQVFLLSELAFHTDMFSEFVWGWCCLVFHRVAFVRSLRRFFFHFLYLFYLVDIVIVHCTHPAKSNFRVRWKTLLVHDAGVCKIQSANSAFILLLNAAISSLAFGSRDWSVWLRAFMLECSLDCLYILLASKVLIQGVSENILNGSEMRERGNEGFDWIQCLMFS